MCISFLSQSDVGSRHSSEGDPEFKAFEFVLTLWEEDSDEDCK